MKSKTSCFNKTIFKKNFTHFWPIWLIVMGWNLFILPFTIYNNSLQYKRMSGLTEKELLAAKEADLISFVNIYMLPAILFIFSVIAAMAVLSYLYNSRSANTIHALPVTRKELYITNYLSGLLFLLIPEFVGFLTGTLVSAACGYSSISYLLQGFLFACGISFFFYSFAIFIGMFTGQLFALPVFALIINFLYVGYKFIFLNIVSLISYGISGEFTNGKLDMFSPLYYMSYKITSDMDYSGTYPVCHGLLGGKVVAGYAVCAVVLVIAAYLIYRSRNMETAGNLISIPWIAPLFRWGVALCGGSLFGALISSIFNNRSASKVFLMLAVTTLIFGMICFFAAQMFLEKGFRVFTKKRVMECGVFLGLFLLVLISIEGNWFGYESRIPDEDEIASAYFNSNYPVGGDDADTIEKILDIHKQIIDSKKEFESFAADSDEVSGIYIKYYLKDGSVFKRNYMIPATDDMLTDNNSVFGKVAEMITDPDAFLKYTVCVGYDKIQIENGYLDGNAADGEYYRHDFSREDAKKVYEAVKKDAQEGNFDHYLLNSMSLTGQMGSAYSSAINFEYTSDEKILNMYDLYTRDTDNDIYMSAESVYSPRTAYITFDENCKNTIAALKEAGVIESENDLQTIDEQSEAIE